MMNSCLIVAWRLSSKWLTMELHDAKQIWLIVGLMMTNDNGFGIAYGSEWCLILLHMRWFNCVIGGRSTGIFGVLPLGHMTILEPKLVCDKSWEDQTHRMNPTAAMVAWCSAPHHRRSSPWAMSSSDGAHTLILRHCEVHEPMRRIQDILHNTHAVHKVCIKFAIGCPRNYITSQSSGSLTNPEHKKTIIDILSLCFIHISLNMQMNHDKFQTILVGIELSSRSWFSGGLGIVASDPRLHAFQPDATTSSETELMVP